MAHIYFITNNATENDEDCYVGSSVRDDARRKKQHFTMLRKNKHHSRPLQNAFNKYGESAFEHHIIEYCSAEVRFERETYWIEQKKAAYNIARVGGGVYGLHWTLTPETRAKMSAAVQERLKSPEYRAKLRAARARQVLTKPRKLGWMCLPGWKQKEETKQKISKALKGRDLVPPESRARARQKLKGRKFSEEHRQKISEAAKRRPVTGAVVERMRRIAAANVGRKQSAETKAKKSAALRAAYERDPTFKVRVSEARRACWARWRARKALDLPPDSPHK